MEKRIFLVHKWETTNRLHNLHIWKDGSEDPETRHFRAWNIALEEAYKIADEMGLDYFQVDHPDFPHKFMKIMRTEDISA